MMAAPRMNLGPQPFSPKVDRSFRGVRIAFSAPPAAEGFPSLRVGILYLLADDQVEALGGKKPAEALVLTLVSGLAVFSENLLGDHLVFEDDYKRRDGLWLGYADFALAEYLKPAPGREAYVTVSLGTWLSNTLHVPAMRA